MAKDWDSARGGMRQWVDWLAERLAECWRVLKPGGHILVWALPRTSHWTGLAIEQAGFDIRDRIAHLFGTGFPKGGMASKAIDKRMGTQSTVVGENPNHRPVSGVAYEGVYQGGNTGAQHLTAPTSPEAQQWDGWANALKPACEDWWLARKPFKGSLVQNVLDNGVGLLHVDACRVGDFVNTTPSGVDRYNKMLAEQGYRPGAYQKGAPAPAGEKRGRWPAHLVLSHHPECKEAGTKVEKGHKGYPNGPGGKSVHWSENSKRSSECRTGAWEGIPDRDVVAWDCHDDCPVRLLDQQNSECSRFFYCAKPSKAERNAGLSDTQNNHPTVKSVALMSWLVRLVTPPDGIVLDPFCGSGSTGVAALKEGFRFVGIEQNADYVEIAKQRLANAVF